MITNLLFPLLTALLAVASPVRRWAPPSPALSLSQYDQQVFDVSMQINDWSWEASTGWIEADDDNGHTSSRFTAWYIVGLLQRNQGNDVANACQAIRNIISLQFTDPQDNGTAWYWTYKQASDIPSPNNLTYPAAIYDTYDPNWSFFIGLAFVQAIEEFEHLLPSDLVDEMVTSTYRAARHLMTRVGLDGDNLVTAYSNPALSRALIVEWVGNRINDQNLTDAGAQYGQDLYDLFTADGYNTLGEYNVPTYYGIDVLALCQWIRHAPSGSKLPQYGKYILQNLWDDIAEHYNFNLKNFVGPYDRVYHRNSLIDNNIITIFFWMLLGRDVSPVAPIGQGSTMYDLRQGACFALVGQTLRDTLDPSINQKLVTPVGSDERDFTRYIRDSLDNNATRVNTAWVAENIMAGGQQVAETKNRGSQFTPMILHWKSGDTMDKNRPFVSFFQLVDTCPTVNATVTPGHISISYANTTLKGSDVFQFLIGDIPAPFYAANKIVQGFEDLPCLDVTVSSQGLNGTVEFSTYGAYSIQNNNLYEVNYYVNTSYSGTPSIDLDVKYTC